MKKTVFMTALATALIGGAAFGKTADARARARADAGEALRIDPNYESAKELSAMLQQKGY